MRKWDNSIREKDYRSTHNVRKTLIILTLIVGILLTLIGIFQPTDKWWSIVLITFGVTFTASASVSIIMLSAGLMDLSENAKELASVIGSRLGMPCAERFTLVESSSEVGLAKTYISREQALQKSKFHTIIEDEKDGLFIVGSSLLGFLQDRHFKHVIETLKKKMHDGVEIKFMLTHPLFADFRAAQEGRDPGEIAREIIKSLRIILSFVGSEKELVSVYLYRGTPTCFGILTKDSVLLNPYPYGRQAYESPCFEFDSQTPAYNLYRQAHFQTQFAGKIERFELSDVSISKLESEIDEFSLKVSEFESSFSTLHRVTTGQVHGDGVSGS
ncbi:MAG: hypothetical protein HZB59_06955 [Ignavibacteriales bacterium]|nr:hypothetical protein [Ignavibacteriales bacterium]